MGELLVNGRSAAMAYWNQRARSLHTFQGPWTRTGDKYIVDVDGLYHYCGRTDDMIKVSGNWVSKTATLKNVPRSAKAERTKLSP